LEAFLGPVIHRRSFDRIKSILDASNKDPSLKLLAGGTYDDSVGFFIHPTVYQAQSPDHRLFNEEIFGPVLAVYVYADSEWSSLLKKVDQAGGGFALTGAVFATDRKAAREAEDALRYSAGNFYISTSFPTRLDRVQKLTVYRLQDDCCVNRPTVLRRC
jgi:1-pyrroline-5-carboxylate dehydrogenase